MAWVTVIVGLAAFGTACSDGGTDASPLSTTTTAPRSTTTAAGTHAAAALDAWREYVAAADEWFNPPNPSDPRIAELLAASALDDYRLSIAQERTKRRATRPGPAGPPEHITTVEEVGPRTARLRDCFVDDTVAYNYETGQVLDDGVSTRKLNVQLVIEDGRWKVEKIDQVSAVEGREPCGD